MNLLRDSFGRDVSYLRLSITDRCDFRCVYCMAEDMTFLPRSEVLSLEELATVAHAFVTLGVKKIRVTGGEPLVRRDAIKLFQQLGQLQGLEELCLTTNGSQLTTLAQPLKDAGVDRINISLDTLKPERFRALTRFGKLEEVLAGIDAARALGFKRIKINAVLLRNVNLDECIDLATFALDKGLDISFIEEMPLGEIDSHQRNAEFISSDDVRGLLEQRFDLQESKLETGGPSRYWDVNGSRNKIGFISPHSNNFCASCNRVRVTAEGRLLLCLGNEHSVDLKAMLRDGATTSELQNHIRQAMAIKPEKHDFTLDEAPQILRFMNATGG